VENKTIKLIVWVVGLFVIRIIIVDTIIQNIYPMIWWINDFIVVMLFVLYSIILWNIKYKQIIDFIRYKETKE